MNLQKFLILTATALCLPARATDLAAQKPELSAETRLVLRSVSERYKKLRNWEAHFTQDVYSVGLAKSDFNEGRFVFQAPNKFRYSLISPEASDFICDGKKAWMITYPEGRKKPARVHVFNDLSQIELERYLVIVRGIDALTPAKEKKLRDDFVINGKSDAVGFALELSPKQSNEVAKIELIFKNDQPSLDKTVITDTLGNKTTIILTAHKIFNAIDPKEFVPDYPKGSVVE